MSDQTDMIPTPIGDGTYEVRWSEMYGGGTATVSIFDTKEEAEAWIDGYNTGARENM